MLSIDEERSLLLTLLKVLETEVDLPNNPHTVFNHGDEDPITVQRIRIKAKKLLLADTKPPQELIDLLLESGFRTCSETEDLFGWLEGAIFTNKGRVVF